MEITLKEFKEIGLKNGWQSCCKNIHESGYIEFHTVTNNWDIITGNDRWTQRTFSSHPNATTWTERPY